LVIIPSLFAIGFYLTSIIGKIFSGNATSDDYTLFFGAIAGALVIFVVIWQCQLSFKKKEKYFNSPNFHEIKIEDIDFSKKYKVYSDSDIESRYFLTTAFLSRLDDIKTAFGVDKLKCAFYKQKIYFAISTKRDLFEFGNLFFNINTNKYCDRMFSEILSIILMIDYFNLNFK
jgi:hypothetical protein